MQVQLSGSSTFLLKRSSESGRLPDGCCIKPHRTGMVTRLVLEWGWQLDLHAVHLMGDRAPCGGRAASIPVGGHDDV